jgi:hypothetical protein
MRRLITKKYMRNRQKATSIVRLKEGKTQTPKFIKEIIIWNILEKAFKR